MTRLLVACVAKRATDASARAGVAALRRQRVSRRNTEPRPKTAGSRPESVAWARQLIGLRILKKEFYQLAPMSELEYQVRVMKSGYSETTWKWQADLPERAGA